jgi:hypothetical protein
LDFLHFSCFVKQSSLNVTSNSGNKKRKISDTDHSRTRSILFGNSDDVDRNDEKESYLSESFSQRKLLGAPQANGTNAVDFVITEETQVLALIEDISTLRQESRPNHTGTNPFQSIRRKIVQRNWPIERPSIGRLLEMPVCCRLGKWMTQILPELERDARQTSKITGQGNGDDTTLQGYRICLRHESQYKIGKLICDKLEQQGISNPPTIRVNSINPSESRTVDVLGQRNCTPLKDHHNDTFFIGSITMVGYAGTLYPSTTNSSPSQSMAHEILHHLKDESSSNGYTDHHNDSKYPKLYKISKGRPGDSAVVGFSILCDLPLEANYHLLYAQDFSLEKNEIVAVDRECIRKGIAVFTNFC